MMIYADHKKEGFEDHFKTVQELAKENPYWLIYDIVKLEHRDGQVL